ncbi:MAG: response regulator transcription factor [Dehalococcoidia bacterium]
MEPLFRDLMERAALPVFLPRHGADLAAPGPSERGAAGARAPVVRRGQGARLCSLRRDGLWLLSLGMLADVCVALGDREGAAALYPPLLPFAGRAITNGIYAAACRWPVARLWRAGRHPRPVAGGGAAFRRRPDLATRMGAWPWSAFTQYEYAAALLARPGLTTTVCRRAITLLRSSRATAGELGMARLATMATTLLSDAAADGKGPFPASLTPREVEVLRLVAAGRSNREIADALVISRFTAVRHVSNILAKIGATNRTEAAGFAARHGLV